MSQILLLFLILFFIVTFAILVMRVVGKNTHNTDVSSACVRKTATELLKHDKRLASLAVLLSYSDMENTRLKSVRGKSNRRLIFEMRQIVRSHLLDDDNRTVNMVTAQILIITKNIGERRRRRKK